MELSVKNKFIYFKKEKQMSTKVYLCDGCVEFYFETDLNEACHNKFLCDNCMSDLQKDEE